MKSLFSFVLLFLVAAVGIVQAEEPPENKPLEGLSAISYAAGFRVGDTFKKQRVPLVPEMVMRGLEDARNSIKPLLPKGEIRMILSDPKKYLIENSDQRADLVKLSSQSFLEENARQEGVVTLPSGLQYKVLASGHGKSPGKDDQVTVNYVGTRLDGTEFDSSARHGKPATFPLKGLIKGWTEALQLMHEGDTWQLFIPADLAYDKRGPLAEQALIFEIELLEVSTL
jgi:FKBP-type peptidyl-prolyl cis-trans isomerase FklB